MNKLFYNNNGISIPALVITIIVLLLLATITIQFAFGENGIITKAQLASKTHKEQESTELLRLEISQLETSLISDKSLNKVFIELKDLSSLSSQEGSQVKDVYFDNETNPNYAYINWNNKYILKVDKNMSITTESDNPETYLAKRSVDLTFCTFDR